MTASSSPSSATASTTSPTFTVSVCSFCRKPSTEVGKLVAGPGVYICDECVQLCVEIIAAAPARPSRTPLAYEVSTEQVLENLPRIAEVGRQLDRDMVAWIQKARELGVTWERIGETLGVTRQSAWERFAGAVAGPADTAAPAASEAP